MYLKKAQCEREKVNKNRNNEEALEDTLCAITREEALLRIYTTIHPFIQSYPLLAMQNNINIHISKRCP